MFHLSKLQERGDGKPNVGSAKIPMFTISSVAQLEALTRKLVDEQRFKLACQAFSRDKEINE
ncbi:unnamed protein product [Sphenostylis stenocarpa]|uniref:Uncharacterized protein n=1 Tax=Sphenostylis stenocarpa TaxID=92480 RepID=A0AA86SVM7_9FABA|nr:unnamed protein product [Sphenostylis stenocarpa]